MNSNSAIKHRACMCDGFRKNARTCKLRETMHQLDQPIPTQTCQKGTKRISPEDGHVTAVQILETIDPVTK